MSAPAKLSYFVRTALGSLWRSPFVHLIAISSVALALVSFGVARVAQAQLETLVRSLGGEVELTVYLQDGTPPEKAEELRAALATRTKGLATLVSPREALERLASELHEPGLLNRQVGEAPLPWSLELKLPPDARAPDALKSLAEKTRALPFVSSVDFGEEALDRLTVISTALRLAVLVVFALVFLTAIIVVSATLQLAIFARRDEIEIQKLVGATDRFVRVPFLIEGFLQGLIAAALAFGVLFAAVRYVERGGGQLLAFLQVGGTLSVDWRRLALEQFGAGLALGLVGSFVAVRRFLRV